MTQLGLTALALTAAGAALIALAHRLGKTTKETS